MTDEHEYPSTGGVTFFSTSFLKSWPDCKMRAVLNQDRRKEEGDTDDEGANPLLFGTVIHNVAERYHEALLREDGPPPDPEELFDEEWKRSPLADYDYFDFGRSEIDAFLERTLFHRTGETIATELHFVYDARFHRVYVVDDVFSEDGDVEKAVQEVRDAGGVPIVSRIDRVDLVSEESVVEVFDYKTNFRPFTRDEVDDSVQLAVYALAAHAMWPEYTQDGVRCCFDLLRHGRFWTSFGPEELIMWRAYLCATWDQVQNTDRALPHVNRYCPTCDWRYRCPEYASVIEDPEHVVPVEEERGEDEPLPMWMRRKYTEYERLKSAAKVLDRRARAIQETLQTAIIEDGDGRPIAIGEDEELYLQANPRYEYPVHDVWRVLEDHEALSLLKQAIRISRPTLEKVLKGRSEIMGAVQPLLETSFVSPTLRTRKKK